MQTEGEENRFNGTVTHLLCISTHCSVRGPQVPLPGGHEEERTGGCPQGDGGLWDDDATVATGPIPHSLATTFFAQAARCATMSREADAREKALKSQLDSLLNEKPVRDLTVWGHPVANVLCCFNDHAYNFVFPATLFRSTSTWRTSRTSSVRSTRRSRSSSGRAACSCFLISCRSRSRQFYQ